MDITRIQKIKVLYKSVYGFPIDPETREIVLLMSDESYIDYYDQLIDKLNLKIDLYLYMEEELNHINFITRIHDMMDEYGISLKTAMEWDAEGFSLEQKDKNKYISSYLSKNKLSDDRMIFYKDIFLGNRKDLQTYKE